MNLDGHNPLLNTGFFITGEKGLELLPGKAFRESLGFTVMGIEKKAHLLHNCLLCSATKLVATLKVQKKLCRVCNN
jgi:hypothetical protein